MIKKYTKFKTFWDDMVKYDAITEVLLRKDRQANVKKNMKRYFHRLISCGGYLECDLNSVTQGHLDGSKIRITPIFDIGKYKLNSCPTTVVSMFRNLSYYKSCNLNVYVCEVRELFNKLDVDLRYQMYMYYEDNKPIKIFHFNFPEFGHVKEIKKRVTEMLSHKTKDMQDAYIKPVKIEDLDDLLMDKIITCDYHEGIHYSFLLQDIEIHSANSSKVYKKGFCFINYGHKVNKPNSDHRKHPLFKYDNNKDLFIPRGSIVNIEDGKVNGMGISLADIKNIEQCLQDYYITIDYQSLSQIVNNHLIESKKLEYMHKYITYSLSPQKTKEAKKDNVIYYTNQDKQPLDLLARINKLEAELKGLKNDLFMYTQANAFKMHGVNSP